MFVYQSCVDQQWFTKGHFPSLTPPICPWKTSTTGRHQTIVVKSFLFHFSELCGKSETLLLQFLRFRIVWASGVPNAIALHISWHYKRQHFHFLPCVDLHSEQSAEQTEMFLGCSIRLFFEAIFLLQCCHLWIHTIITWFPTRVF